MNRAKLAVATVLVGAGLAAMAGCSSDDSEPADAGQSPAAVTETGAEAGQADAGEGSSADEKASSGQGGDGGSPAAGQPGEYVDYSPELVASTEGDKLLFFHAPWCSQCQALEDDIEAGGVPDGVTIFKVDYDSNQDLREEYGVTIQTTVVKVDDDGDEIDSYIAYDDPTLDNVSAALLQQ